MIVNKKNKVFILFLLQHCFFLLHVAFDVWSIYLLKKKKKKKKKHIPLLGILFLRDCFILNWGVGVDMLCFCFFFLSLGHTIQSECQAQTCLLWRCTWCIDYCCRKWTRRHEFKSWTRMIAFHIALIPLGKVRIQFSLQLWVNSRTDWVF